MTNRNPPVNPFPKGNKLGPGGNRVPKELTEARKLNKVELEIIFNKYLHMGLDELTALMVKKDIPVIEALVLRILHKALSEGDQLRLNFFIERLCGKVKEEVKVEHDVSVKFISIDPKEAQKAIARDPFNPIVEIEYKEVNATNASADKA